MNTLLNWSTAALEGQSLGPWLLAAKLTCLLAIGWLLHAALGRSNPHARVLLWRTVALGAVLLMLTALAPSFVQWPVLPPPQSAATPMTSESPREITDPARLVRKFEPSRAMIPPEIARSRDRQPAQHLANEPPDEFGPNAKHPQIVPAMNPSDALPVAAALAPVSAAPVETVPMKGSEPAAASPATTRIPLLCGLAAVWCAGVLLGMLRLLLGLWQLARVRQTTVAVPDWVAQEATAIAAALGLHRRFDVRQTSRLQTPCVVGIFRPLVLLPERQCQREQRDELGSILAHELAHLNGFDLHWNSLITGLSTVLWFHPLVWRVRHVHSNACDAVVTV